MVFNPCMDKRVNANKININERGRTRWTEVRLTSLATGSNLIDSTNIYWH